MKKSFTILKKAAAFLLCVTLCLGLIPAFAAEVGANLVDNGDMEALTELTTNHQSTSTFYYANTESAAQNNNKVSGFSKGMTQIAPTVITEDGTDNKVIALGYDETGEALATTSSNFYVNTQTKNTMEVWEIDVMLPEVTAGTTGLFYYGINGNDWWMSGSSDASCVMIKNDQVYLVSTANVTSQNYGVLLPMDETLAADTWYKFVRVMDFSTKTNMQKVFVYKKEADGSYTLIGRTAGWAQASKENAGAPASIRSRAFFAKGYSDSVLFDNFAVYKAEYKIDDISLDGGGNTIGVLDATSAQTLAVRANWLYALEHDYSIRLKLSDVTEGSQINLFSLGNETYLFTNSTYVDSDIRYNAKLGLNRSVLVIKGGKVYSNYYDGSTETTTVIKDKNGNDLVLDANTWYTFDVHGYLGAHGEYVSADDAGKYTISIKEGSEEIAVAEIVKETYGRKGVGQYYPLSLISAKGFASPVYFDDVKATAGYEATAAFDIAGVDTDLEGNEAGSALLDVVTSSDFGRTYKAKGSGLTATNAYLASDFSGTYLDGTVTSTTLAPLQIKFSAAIDAASFNKDNVVFKANGVALDEEYSLSYDEETLTGTVTFTEKLAYETDYTLEILPSISSGKYGLPLAAGASYAFSTPEDLFEIDDMKFETTTDGINYTEVADLSKALSVGTKVRAKVSMTNLSLEPRDFLVVCVAFSDENEMLDIKVFDDEIPQGTVYSEATETAVTTEDLTITEANTRVEMYVWDNWKQLRPMVVKSVLPEN